MSSNNSGGGGGCIGTFIAVLQVLFIGLKLTEYIDWPWIWVLSPIWISAGLIALILIIVFIAAVVLSD
jgi:hypothetical protein